VIRVPSRTSSRHIHIMLSLRVWYAMRSTSLLASLIALTATLLAAQQPPITFKVEVNYVEIDAVVTDGQGNFVRGLTKNDFQVFEDGVPQSVSAIALVDLPLERPDPLLFASAPLDPDVQSNRREFDGRVFVLVLDDLNTHFSRSPRVKAAAKQFIERYLGANDLAAVVQTGGSTRGVQEFTSSRSRLLRAVDAFMGQGLRSATLEALEERARMPDVGSRAESPPLTDMERAHKARNTLSSLKNVAEYLTGVRGRRKAVVLFSEGISYDTTNPIANRYASEITDRMREAIAEASRGNVSFYAIDPRGLWAFDDAIEMQAPPPDNSLGLTSLAREVRLAQDSLRSLADETGGFAAVNQNDYRKAFARVIQDNSSYYLLGYYSSNSRRDGRFRTVEVRVTRPGLNERSRKGYTAPQGRPPSEKLVDRSASPELREALNSPIPVSGLGISVVASPFKGSGSEASIVLALEVDGSPLRFETKDGIFSDDVEIAIVALDDRAKVRAGARDVAQLRLRPQNHAIVAAQGFRMMRRLEVPPGHYHLRIGARDVGSGAVGSVLYDLDVPDFSKAPLDISGLLITSASASRIPTVNPDPDFKEVMPAPPAAMRDFPPGDLVSVFAEIYQRRDRRVNDRTPHRVAIRGSVIADDGKEVFTHSEERSSDELTGGGGGYGFRLTIPLKDLAPGRYVLRVEARSLISGGTSVARDVEFRIQ
jgi:VWFA-related protein